MKSAVAIALALSALAFSAGAETATSRVNALPTVRAGTPYATARATLLRAHALPDTAGSRSRDCTLEADICRVYPELETCSQGLHFCNFNWLAADGRRFTITTAGEMVDRLTVQ